METKPKIESKTELKTKFKKTAKIIAFRFLKIVLAVAVAVTGSLPFLLWPEIIKKLAVAGYIGLFVACFLTNATVFLPASGIAFTISASTVLNPLFSTIIGGVGTACGELISYCCGRAGKNVVEDTPFLFRIQTYVQKYGDLRYGCLLFCHFHCLIWLESRQAPERCHCRNISFPV